MTNGRPPAINGSTALGGRHINPGLRSSTISPRCCVSPMLFGSSSGTSDRGKSSPKQFSSSVTTFFRTWNSPLRSSGCFRVARCSTFTGIGTDNKGNRIAFGSPTTDYGVMQGEYWAA
jgi:hypothetical protein